MLKYLQVLVSKITTLPTVGVFFPGLQSGFPCGAGVPCNERYLNAAVRPRPLQTQPQGQAGMGCVSAVRTHGSAAKRARILSSLWACRRYGGLARIDRRSLGFIISRSVGQNSEPKHPKRISHDSVFPMETHICPAVCCQGYSSPSVRLFHSIQFDLYHSFYTKTRL